MGQAGSKLSHHEQTLWPAWWALPTALAELGVWLCCHMMLGSWGQPAQPAPGSPPCSMLGLTMKFPETFGWKTPSKEQWEKEQLVKSKSLLTCRAQRFPFPVPTKVTVVLRARLGLSFSVQGLS